MKKITVEETINILQNKRKFYNRLLILIPIIVLFLFIYPRLSLVLTIAVFIVNFGSGYYKMSTVPNFINEFYYSDYKTFQKENFLLGSTQQSYHLFIKSRYFKPDNSGFIELYKEVVKRICIIHFSMFILFSISMSRNFL